MSEYIQEAKNRIQKVFSYIRELTKLRTPPISQSSAYDWQLRYSALPNYPTIQTVSISDDSQDDFDDVILRVKRPTETSCPHPPKELESWIENGWEQLNSEATHLDAKNKTDKSGQTVTEKFEDDLERVAAFRSWKQNRHDWQVAEKPVREAAQVFSDFFKLQAQLLRESEKYQLYLGDGHFVWGSAIGAVDHPILLKKVELEFDSSIPEFLVRETDDSPELYTALLRHHELDGMAILACKKRLEEMEPHPLANSRTIEFLKYSIQRFFQNGQFYHTRNEVVGTSPLIYRDPIIFLGNRAQGFAEALDKLIEAIPNSDLSSEALIRIVGINEEKLSEDNQPLTTRPDIHLTPISNVAEVDFLLTKPANKEQERVITRLEQTGSVLVQGPPGTGKSHTIANIIGHLLASGKTILVSSHTSKALRVVREKVVSSLQPLCVAVLENDTESKSQLEESITGIVTYLSRTDNESLTREIEQLGLRRSQIKLQLEAFEAKALEIRKGEYTDIVVAGEAIPPAEAARKVCEFEQVHGWIPGPMEYGSPLPLSASELQELYQTNTSLLIEDEHCLDEGLPKFSEILKPADLRDLAHNLSAVDRQSANRYAELWKNTDQDLQALDRLSVELGKALEIFSAHKWIRKVVEDSKLGSDHLQPWFNLMETIDSTAEKVAKRTELVLKYGPQITVEITPELLVISQEIVKHLSAGKKLSFFRTVFKPSWKRLISLSRVDEGIPSRIEHFEAIIASLEITKLRQELIHRWERQIVALGGPKLDANAPDIHAKSFIDALKLATSWTASIWLHLEDELQKQGFYLKEASEKVSLSGKAKSYIDQIQELAETVIVPAIEARRLWVRMKTLEAQRDNTLQVLTVHSQKPFNGSAYLHLMIKAVGQLIPHIYELHFNRLLDLHSKVDIYKKRKTLIAKLAQTASGWAKAVELRSGIHGAEILLGNPSTAWKLSQWKQELDRRLSQDYSAVQREIQRLKTEISDVNAQYVEKLAWRFQVKRTSLREKQALTGWQQLQKKITKAGRGKRDVHLKREARKTLKDCKNAVPVWIMPLSRVYDSFDLVQTKFDVLLLDEASQSDITALVAFTIARQVIVVGDNAQVTPQAVGQELLKIQSLIDEMLQDIPNRMLYDGKTSVYDLAVQAFGETIRLVEHFRCVPDIIQFSNLLSYNGEICPLREASSSPYSQHLIAHRVEGAISESKKNQKEALEIASIVAAMTEMKEYSSSSIGIISMVGQEQAIVIDSILQKRLQASSYSKHSLLCGNASQFQGDERDVMLISMVDSCDTPPLPMRQTEDFKKSFNVAASRARNQLWVIHSLNPSTDLKPGDLRLRLIQHAENPKALSLAIEATQKRADLKSVVFEPMVIKDLMLAGFRVIPQWKVGAYTIDMIVKGSERNIAIECDGDRYHPPEKLAEDIQRQMVLERLGWKFIRIRGSEYFRFREAAIKRVITELEMIGIEKLGPIESVAPEVDETSDELRRKVLQRAQEIRLEWEASPEPEQNVKSKRTGWGRKAANETHSTERSADIIAPTQNEHQSTLTSPELSSKQVSQNRKNNESQPTQKTNVETLETIDPKKILDFLHAQGFEVIDKRPVGGSLWVIDSPTFKALVPKLIAKGLRFMFAENGSKSTKDRAAWYTKLR